MTQELISVLTQVAHRWLDRHYVLRQQALVTAAHEFCLSPASFELALDWIFSQWTAAKMSEIIAHNPFKQHHYAMQILAGNTPAVIAQGFLQAAILNIPQCIKIPSKQTTFASLLQQTFVEMAVPITPLLELITELVPRFYSQLSQADLVLAYGSDETMETLKSHLAPTALFVAHGQAESVAIIFKDAANVDTLEKLAYDFLSYDQRGCLSPRLTFVEQGGVLSPAECAHLFAEKILPPLAQQLPRGGLFPGEAAEILHQRNLFGFRGQVYRGEDWTVSYIEQPSWLQTALPRFMPFMSFATWQQLMAVLRPQQASLISIGYAGSNDQIEQLKQTTPIRFCALGEMQKQLLIF